MKKLALKIIAIVVIGGALALAGHQVLMSADMAGDMSASCSTVCLTQGDTGTAVPIVAALFVLAVALIVLPLLSPLPRRAKGGWRNSIFLDRHRYLMKTMVMLR